MATAPKTKTVKPVKVVDEDISEEFSEIIYDIQLYIFHMSNAKNLQEFEELEYEYQNRLVDYSKQDLQQWQQNILIEFHGNTTGIQIQLEGKWAEQQLQAVITNIQDLIHETEYDKATKLLNEFKEIAPAGYIPKALELEQKIKSKQNNRQLPNWLKIEPDENSIL